MRVRWLCSWLVLLGACSSESPSDSGVDVIARDAGDVASMDVALRDTAPPLDVAPTDAAPMGARCSADLRSVLASDGAVIATCPLDQGCLRGMCAPACAAAAGSQGNVGCRFLLPTPPVYPATRAPCFAVFVANTWSRPAQITVARGATIYDVTRFGRMPRTEVSEAMWPAVPAGGLPSGQVAVLFLSHDPMSVETSTGAPLRCPVAPALAVDTIVAGSGISDAWRVESDTPVSAFDIMPYGGAASYFPSATMLFPSTSWGTSYVVSSAPPGDLATPGPLFTQIVATMDDTTVRIKPTVDMPAGPMVPLAPRGAVTSVTLDAGQYVQWEQAVGAFDPSGSLVTADHPVAVFAGNRNFMLRGHASPGRDSTHQQMQPAESLGAEYVGAPYATRRADLMPEVIPYRVVGTFDGTRLTFDPPIAGAPTTLDQGQVTQFETALSFRVTSQDAMHPFSFSQLMTSCDLPGGSRPGTISSTMTSLGDDEHVIVVPPAQFLSRYVFFTDPTYGTTNLVITRSAVAGRFHDVRVDCIGVVTGWRPVGTDGRFETTDVDLVRGGRSVSGCINGGHIAESDAPFGLTVWGEDYYASYAYPGGSSAAALSSFEPLIPR